MVDKNDRKTTCIITIVSPTGEPVPGNIGNQNAQVFIINTNEIIIIAAGFGRRLVIGKETEPGNIGKLVAKQALLNRSDNILFAFDEGVRTHQLIIKFFGSQHRLHTR